MRKYEIDATNKRLGRIATEAAVFLMGKDQPDFARNRIPDVSVIINNAAKIDLTENKKQSTIHTRYSGYPGGLKKLSSSEIIEKSGFEALLRKAVYGMLPTNKLRAQMIKRLTINE